LLIGSNNVAYQDIQFEFIFINLPGTFKSTPPPPHLSFLLYN
jgi:hypothetical protein